MEPDEGATTLRTKLGETNYRYIIFNHMRTDQLQQKKLHWRLIILALQLSTLFYICVAISRQLNIASYLCSVHKPCPLLQKKTDPGVHTACWPTCDLACVLVLLPDQWPWSLVWEWDTMCAWTKWENGVLRDGQQPQCCESLLLTRWIMILVLIGTHSSGLRNRLYP